MRKQVNGKRLHVVKTLASRRPHSRAKTNVFVGSGELDQGMLSSAIREWIVPVLVREFLAEYPICTARTTTNSEKGTTGLHGEEGAGLTRIDPNGH